MTFRSRGGSDAIAHFHFFVGVVWPLGFSRHEHGGQLRFVDIVATGQR